MGFNLAPMKSANFNGIEEFTAETPRRRENLERRKRSWK